MAHSARDAPLPTDAALVDAAKAGVRALLANVGADANAEGEAWVLNLDDAALRLKVFYSKVPGSALLRFKGVCELGAQFAPQFVQTAVSDNAARLKWDGNMLALDTVVLRGAGAPAAAPALEPGAGGADAGVRRVVLLRSATKQVGPVSGREFVDVTAICDDGFAGVPPGSVASGGAGVVDAARFPDDASLVRGWNSPGCGWLFERRADGGTRVHYVIQSDLKGWFLPMIINSVLTGSYKTFFGDLQKRLAELEAAGSKDGLMP
jgi:hypothetical protein